MLPRDKWGHYENAAPIDHLDLTAELGRWSGIGTAGSARLGRRPPEENAAQGAAIQQHFANRGRLGHRHRRSNHALIVLLHGRGSQEREILALADHLPAEPP